MTDTRSGDEPWVIYFLRRHSADDRGESVPGRDFLDACPTKVRATMLAVLGAVADAPPPKFSGGGYWEVMRDEMSGFYEVLVNGPQRKHFRLFCVLERHGTDVGVGGPAIIVITGMVKPFRTEFKASDYRRVRRLGDEYRKRTPRSVA
jgi:hypothetical protein